jgi:Mg-chelatase subunit ChlD
MKGFSGYQQLIPMITYRPFVTMSKFLGTKFMCSRPSHLLLSLFLVTAIYAQNRLFGQSTPNGSEESPYLTYHSTVSEVRLVFFATDEHNHSVEGLQKNDFAVVDDEMVIREFRSFTRSDLIKLDVIVLIDSSESVLPHFEQEITEAHQLISQSPWGPGDSVSVLSFGGMESHLICSGNCGSSFASGRLASLPTGGPTPLFDALEVATNLLVQRKQPDVWPVIILFSDGEDTISKASLRGTLKKLMASEAQVYAVEVSSPERPTIGTATLQRIAEDSGGRRFPISEGVVRIFSDVINDLHSARVVTYVPPQSGTDFHAIRILPTHNLKLQFRCRRGYYSQSGSVP